MGAEQRAGQRWAGAKRIVQVEVFFPSLIEQGAPGAGLPCIDIDAVVRIQSALRVQVRARVIQAGSIDRG